VVSARDGIGATPPPGQTRGPVVIKLGGRALELPGALSQMSDELRELGRAAVIVHGGGGEVSAWCAKLGLEPRFSDGLRVTDADTLEVAAAVLAGLANKRLVAALRSRGVDALGLAALDAGLARVTPHTDADRLGEVGEVRAIETSWLERLMAEGRVPVLSSLGADGARLLNLNADDLAAALAGALRAALLLLSDAPGVRLGGRVVRRLETSEIAHALESPEVTGGMVPKLRAAARAIEGGASDVWIARWAGAGTLAALLSGRASGTHITREETAGETAADSLEARHA
jgi:acetylglutamate kinase